MMCGCRGVEGEARIIYGGGGNNREKRMLARLCVETVLRRIRQADRYHCHKSSNIPKTEIGQIHLNFVTVL